ncbi:MAG: hypothetical protein SAL07_10365 [Oscillatoria sp. PMC 1051.18]|nr:hypothetical protein [Oscillatoria sp. PMC 1050.18]MEC5030306.1 hypothetical protein [Oscillatoria sp. PMC 1051.18]
MLERLITQFTNQKNKSDLELSLEELPEEIASESRQAIADLAAPEPYRQVVTNAVTEAVSKWQAGAETANSLVFLASPIENLAKLLDEVILNSEILVDVSVNCFGQQRPNDLSKIPKELAELLKKSESKIIVIPSLSQCFLRCIGGLDGIVYLREQVLENTQVFWLIGCNYWTWEYLDYLCQIRAYFEEEISLPVLTWEEIQDWLEPAAKRINADVSKEIPELQRIYLEKLAGVYLGIPAVAACLWLRSLHYHPESKTVIRRKHSLPDLPSLNSSDRYLLYALLLHEKMNLSALATSLGESQSVIRADVQKLRKLSLIEANYSQLNINPLYYPKLRLELSQNNFLVAGEN